LNHSSENSEFTYIGQVVNVHGLKGFLKAISWSDYPEYYQNLKQLMLETSQGLQWFEVSQISWKSSFWLIALKTIARRDEAEKLKGSKISIPDQWLKPLEAGEFFQHDLLGCRVEDLQGKFLGEVFNIFETGANDVYEIRQGTKEFLIPSTPEVIQSINIQQKKIIVELIPGLLD